MSDGNVTKSGRLLLLARNVGDTAWEIIGGVKTRGYSFDNPVEEITSQSTVGEYTESEWVGYSSVSINLSGAADQRTTQVQGFDVVGASRLMALATTGERCGKFQILNVDTSGTLDGTFNITNFSSSGDNTSLLSFEATLNNTGIVTQVGVVL